MVDQKITEFITQQREQITPDNIIIDTLLKAGYNKEDIDEGFKLISMTESTEIPVSDLKEKKPSRLPLPHLKLPSRGVAVLLTAFLFIILLVVGGTMFLSQLSTNDEESVPKEEIIEEDTEPTEIPTAAESDASSPEEQEVAQERNAKRKEDIDKLQQSLEAYFVVKQEYPSSLNLLYPDYLKVILVDPGTLRPYNYFVREEGQSYVICVTQESKTNRQCASKGNNPFDFPQKTPTP